MTFHGFFKALQVLVDLSFRIFPKHLRDQPMNSLMNSLSISFITLTSHFTFGAPSGIVLGPQIAHVWHPAYSFDIARHGHRPPRLKL
jgi:hypothetical protein